MSTGWREPYVTATDAPPAVHHDGGTCGWGRASGARRTARPAAADLQSPTGSRPRALSDHPETCPARGSRASLRLPRRRGRRRRWRRWRPVGPSGRRPVPTPPRRPGRPRRRRNRPYDRGRPVHIVVTGGRRLTNGRFSDRRVTRAPHTTAPPPRITPRRVVGRPRAPGRWRRAGRPRVLRFAQPVRHPQIRVRPRVGRPVRRAGGVRPGRACIRRNPGALGRRARRTPRRGHSGPARHRTRHRPPSKRRSPLPRRPGRTGHEGPHGARPDRKSVV